jgi:predicted DNA-binding transcriptional regulator AlpA
MITRKELAAHCGFCTRTIDELTRGGVLPHYKIGKSVRYDLADVEATLRQRFHVRPAGQGSGEMQDLPQNAESAPIGCDSSSSSLSETQRVSEESPETNDDSGLGTSRPTTATSITNPPAA